MIDHGDRGCRRIRSVAAVLAAAVWLASPSVRAEIAGRYKTQSQRVNVNVKTWGEDCGARPRSYSTGGGKVVEVQRVGANLRIGAQRTDRCWSRNPRVQRKRASVGATRWFVECETPADDPRFEHGEYTLEQVDENTLRLREESRYDWRLEGDHCQATVVLTRTYVRLPDEPSEPATPSEPPPPEEPEGPGEPEEPGTPETTRCQGPPGPAVRLDVRPARVQIAPGGRVCFRAVGRDREGCPVEVEATWTRATDGSTVRDSGGRLTKNGCYEASSAIQAAEGRVVVVATAGELTDRALIGVRALDISDLIAASLEDGFESPDASIPSAEAEARPGAAQGVGRTEVSPADEPKGVLWAVLMGAAVAALLLAVVALVIMRRRKKQDALDEEIDEIARAAKVKAKAEAPSEPPAAALACPTCGRTFAGGQEFCPDDATPLVPASVAAQAAETGENLICPRCRRGYPPGTATCPKDSEELVPYSVWRASRLKEKRGEVSGQMLCPTCGSRFDAGTRFCPKDGAKLEPAG